jgi:hypothetical protein
MAVYLPQQQVPGANAPQDVRLAAGWPPDSRLLMEVAEQVPPEVRGTVLHSRVQGVAHMRLQNDGWLACSECPVLALAPLYGKPKEAPGGAPAAAAGPAVHPAGARA